MWRFWIFLCTSFLAESHKTDYMELLFGEQFSIKVSLSESLEFTSVDESDKYTVWAFNPASKRGSIRGSKSNRRYLIRHVSFEDEGTYTRRNIMKTVNYLANVKVFAKRTAWSCVRGKTCNIPLNGIEKDKATLTFSNKNVNLTLMVKGTLTKDLPDFSDRIKITSSSIQVLKFNVSDDGNYTLYDGQNRKAVTTRMYLIEPHDGIDASPLLSLLLLLGIPIGCCCCRKRLFKKKSSQATAMTSVLSPMVVPPPGLSPDYNSFVDPAGPGQIYTPGYPAPGESQDHPPPYLLQPQYGGEPAMPQNPQGPVSGCPPAHLPQWIGPPYNSAAPAMYTPDYPAPGDSQVHPPPANPAYPSLPQFDGQPAMPPNPGFTPVIYSAGFETEGNKEGLKMNEISVSSPLIEPSLTEVGPPPAPYTGMDVLNSNSSTVQFNSTRHNFL